MSFLAQLFKCDISELCGMRFLMLFQVNNFLGYLWGEYPRAEMGLANLRMGIIQFDATSCLEKSPAEFR